MIEKLTLYVRFQAETYIDKANAFFLHNFFEFQE